MFVRSFSLVYSFVCLFVCVAKVEIIFGIFVCNEYKICKICFLKAKYFEKFKLNLKTFDLNEGNVFISETELELN